MRTNTTDPLYNTWSTHILIHAQVLLQRGDRRDVLGPASHAQAEEEEQLRLERKAAQEAAAALERDYTRLPDHTGDVDGSGALLLFFFRVCLFFSLFFQRFFFVLSPERF